MGACGAGQPHIDGAISVTQYAGLAVSSALLLGIDEGTTAVKAALFDLELRAIAEARRPVTVTHPQPGWVEQDPELVLQAVVDAVAEVLEHTGGREVLAAGLDHQGESVLAWDADSGRALTPVVVWQDKRQQDEQLLAAFGVRREWLPEIGPTFGTLGELRHERWPVTLPLAAQLVDQQAALAGSGAVRPGELKATYGTGVFTGVGAPWWHPNAHGVIAGLHPGVRPAHVGRAALEAIASRVADIVEAMAEHTPIHTLRVDGGLTNDKTLLQIQADALGLPLTVGRADTTVLGAAMLAGVGAGVFASVEDAAQRLSQGRVIQSRVEAPERLAQRERWRAFVEAGVRL